MKNLNASGTPSHWLDIHMPNHSPPTDMKPTCHRTKPSVRPAIAMRFAELKMRAP